MTLESLFNVAVRVVNAMEPEARSAILPIRDVDTFREHVAQTQQAPANDVERTGRTPPAAGVQPEGNGNGQDKGQAKGKERQKGRKALDVQIDTHTFAAPEIN
jgi:hypothetical protein